MSSAPPFLNSEKSAEVAQEEGFGLVNDYILRFVNLLTHRIKHSP